MEPIDCIKLNLKAAVEAEDFQIAMAACRAWFPLNPGKGPADLQMYLHNERIAVELIATPAQPLPGMIVVPFSGTSEEPMTHLVEFCVGPAHIRLETLRRYHPDRMSNMGSLRHAGVLQTKTIVGKKLAGRVIDAVDTNEQRMHKAIVDNSVYLTLIQ